MAYQLRSGDGERTRPCASTYTRIYTPDLGGQGNVFAALPEGGVLLDQLAVLRHVPPRLSHPESSGAAVAAAAVVAATTA